MTARETAKTLFANPERLVRVSGLFFLILASALAGWIALERDYFNLGTESDFLGRFVGDAQAIQHGETLRVDIHLPGYAMVLAGVERVIGDWLASGLLISWISCVVTLLVVWRLFTLIGGGWAGLGAVAGLAASTVFLAYAAQATSDILFLALFFGSLLAFVHAMQVQRLGPWLLAGALAGFTFLARTNGLVVLMLAGIPLLASAPGTRFRDAGSFIVGALVPLTAWAAFAVSTDSPLLPTETHTNIALTYFTAEGGCANEKRRGTRAEYTSTFDVLMADPVHIAKEYSYDLAALPLRIWRRVTWPPLAAAGSLALLFWLTRLRSKEQWIVFGTALLMVLLMGLKDFEARYYLFAAPYLGAAIGVAVAAVLQERRAAQKTTAASIAVLCVFFAVGMAVAASHAFEGAQPSRDARQIRESVAAARRLVAADAVVVARKHIIPYYTGAGILWFPDGDSPADLCRGVVAKVAPGTPVYVFIGSAEQRCRPVLSDIVLNRETPAWIDIVARGSDETNPWALGKLKHRNCALLE